MGVTEESHKTCEVTLTLALCVPFLRPRNRAENCIKLGSWSLLLDEVGKRISSWPASRPTNKEGWRLFLVSMTAPGKIMLVSVACFGKKSKQVERAGGCQREKMLLYKVGF